MISSSISIAPEKLKAIIRLTKFRLSLTVVFSGVFGYLLGANEINIAQVLIFAIAAYGTTAAANIINQIKEVDLDREMSRTKDRPLPLGIVSIEEAKVLAVILGLISINLLLIVFNWKAASLALLSLLLYGFLYTPLKQIGPIAVVVGALPGAFPPMIGWLAATSQFGLEPGILFAIQFFWQFPHFWAIAWVLDDDYKKAGFKLLPSKGGKNLNSAIQIMIYTLFLLPLCWVPYLLGMTGINSALVAMVCGIAFLAQTFHLMRHVSTKAAKQLMFGSFLYLPVVQIAYLLDKL